MAITPQPPTVLFVAGNSMTVTFGEDNQAAAAYTWNPLTAYTGAGGSTAAPFYALLNTAHADQAAARAYFLANFRWNVWLITGTIAGTDLPEITVDCNVSAPAVAGNFRLVLTSVKTANGDLATWAAVIDYRHSLIA